MAMTGWSPDSWSETKEAPNEGGSLRMRTCLAGCRRDAVDRAGPAACQGGARSRSQCRASACHDGDRAGLARRQDGKRSVMMKTLACADLVPGCPAVVTAETEEEILRIAAQHAVEAHGLTVDDGLMAAVKGAIRDKAS